MAHETLAGTIMLDAVYEPEGSKAHTSESRHLTVARAVSIATDKLDRGYFIALDTTTTVILHRQDASVSSTIVLSADPLMMAEFKTQLNRRYERRTGVPITAESVDTIRWKMEVGTLGMACLLELGLKGTIASYGSCCVPATVFLSQDEKTKFTELFTSVKDDAMKSTSLLMKHTGVIESHRGICD